MVTTLGELARLVGGEVCGDESTVVVDAATLDAARPDEICFATHAKYAVQVAQANVAAVVVPPDFPVENSTQLIRVENPREAFATIVKKFRPPRISANLGISEHAFISPTATLGEGTQVHPGAHIGDDVRVGKNCVIHAGVVIQAGSKLGDDCTLFPNVVIYDGSVLGSRVMLHAGVVIGAYGFGYDTVQGRHICSDQLGYVEIHDDVEIGAKTTIDRGTYGRTSIGEGTKIDNNVMIGHNCRIGKHNLICSQVGIAGSSTTGDYVVMAGQVGVPDHVNIGNRVILGAKSGVMRDVPDDVTMLGTPATPERDQMAKQAVFAKLPELRKQVRELQRTVDRLLEREAARDYSRRERGHQEPTSHPEPVLHPEPVIHPEPAQHTDAA